MGSVTIPPKVKPVFGLLYREVSLYQEVLEKIKSNFSPVDFQSDEFPFVETDYYSQEMGEGLTRRYISTEKLIDATELIHYKHISNLWEEQYMVDGRRRINIDPGYITSSNLILASTKNFSHRLYLGRGIFGEVTMRYENKDFTRLPWTYPDYYTHRDVLLHIRNIYRRQLKSENEQGREESDG